MLDLIQAALISDGVSWVRVDGSTPAKVGAVPAKECARGKEPDGVGFCSLFVESFPNAARVMV